MSKFKLEVIRQYLVPQHILSRLVGLAATSTKRWFKNAFIKWFIKRYGVDMSEAVERDPLIYPCFNDFFTRHLRHGARPIAEGDDVIVSPVDGAISQLGKIKNGRIFQAKGFDFTVQELLGDIDTLTDTFQNGQFSTMYLAPKDYHRVHMPCYGQLKAMIYIPGKLFSVNNTTTNHVPRLFARNERVVCVFATHHGPMAMVLVGAMIVASINTVWAGQVAPQRPRKITAWHYDKPIAIEKGEEMGHFMLGSTVITLFSHEKLRWSNTCQADSTIQLGQTLASVENASNDVGVPV